MSLCCVNRERELERGRGVELKTVSSRQIQRQTGELD